MYLFAVKISVMADMSNQANRVFKLYSKDLNYKPFVLTVVEV